MKVIGLTGGIAAGKSTVSAMLQELGAVILDADAIGRELMTSGQPAWKRVYQHFGNAYMLSNGEIDRRKLGQLVFSDPSALEKLNNITHPLIKEYIQGKLKDFRKEGFDGVVVIDAALIFEVGWDKMVDEVWVVTVDYETQLRRLMNRNNYTREEAVNRISSQMSQEEKVAKADKVINNSLGIDYTFEQVKTFWYEMKNEKE